MAIRLYVTADLYIHPALKDNHRLYLRAFRGRLHRPYAAAAFGADPVRDALGLPPGKRPVFMQENCFQCQCLSPGQRTDSPPLSVAGDQIKYLIDDVRNEDDNPMEWLAYLIENFLRHWGYRLNGECRDLAVSLQGFGWAVYVWI